MLLLIMLLLIVLFVVIGVEKYNKMVKSRNKVKESLRLIDIHLKLRFDLIPNLVSTVKGYAKHEQEIFTKLMELRKKAIEAKDEKEKIGYANDIVPNINKVLFVAEKYPELKADSLYKKLMEELILVEDKIAASRRFFDSNVTRYNTIISTFPNVLIAKVFGFEEMELFKIDTGDNFFDRREW